MDEPAITETPQPEPKRVQLSDAPSVLPAPTRSTMPIHWLSEGEQESEILAFALED